MPAQVRSTGGIIAILTILHVSDINMRRQFDPCGGHIVGQIGQKIMYGAARLRLRAKRLASIIISSDRTAGERGRPDAMVSNVKKSTHA
jgi:hypothetical protein